MIYTGVAKYIMNKLKLLLVTDISIKQSNKKGKCQDKIAVEISWNEYFVYLMVPYEMFSKVNPFLSLKSITIINPVTRWFNTIQYKNKSTTVASLVETAWFKRYPLPKKSCMTAYHNHLVTNLRTLL